jgi:hypothetical protein
MIAVVMMVASVKMAFINDFKPFWRESCCKLCLHHVLFAIVNGHFGQFSPYRRCASYRRRLGGNPWGKSAQELQSASKFRPEFMAKTIQDEMSILV